MKVRKLYIYLFLFFISLYTVTMPGHIYEIDTGLRVFIAKNILEKYTPGFDKTDLEKLDSKCGFSKAKNGRYYSYHALGQSIIFVPFSIIGKTIHTFSQHFLSDNSLEEIDFVEFLCSFASVLFSVFLVLLVAIFCARLGYKEKVSATVALLFGVTTAVWPYSRTGYNNLEEAFFCLASYLVLIGNTRNYIPKSRYILSGLFIGSGLLIRPTAILMLPSILFLILQPAFKKNNIAYFLKERGMKLSLFLLGFVPFLYLILFYNYLRYGSIFKAGYELPFIKLESSISPLPLFSLRYTATGFLKLFFSPNYSFFIYNPVLIYIFIALRGFFIKHKRIAVSFLLAVGLNIFFCSSLKDPYGMWAYGPRYLFPIVPLGIIFLTVLFSEWQKVSKFKKIIFSFLILISVILQIPAVSVSYKRFLIENIWHRKIEEKEIIWNVKFSPIKSQFINFFKAISNMKNKKSYSFKVERDADAKHVLDRSIALNVINWWWILAYYRGIKFALFIPFILLGLIIFSLYKIRKELLIQ